MSKINIKYCFIALLFFAVKSPYAQKIEFIWDYYALYNQYSNCMTRHSITSPWFLNGTFAKYGYGHIGLPTKTDNIDTVSFMYFIRSMSILIVISFFLIPFLCLYCIFYLFFENS